MLNWLWRSTACPIDDGSRQWLETRMQRLYSLLGSKPICHQPPLEPTTLLLNNYQGRREDVERFLHIVSSRMIDDAASFRLQFFEEDHPAEQTGGVYGRREGGFDVWLQAGAFAEPLSVAASIARELALVLLIGCQGLDENDPDLPQLSDLATVYTGLGLLTANAVLHELNFHAGPVTAWSIGRQGSLSMPHFGYALALYAVARNEMAPAWLRHLRPDVAVPCKQGLRFLQATTQCAFTLCDAGDRKESD